MRISESEYILYVRWRYYVSEANAKDMLEHFGFGSFPIDHFMNDQLSCIGRP